MVYFAFSSNAITCLLINSLTYKHDNAILRIESFFLNFLLFKFIVNINRIIVFCDFYLFIWSLLSIFLKWKMKVHIFAAIPNRCKMIINWLLLNKSNKQKYPTVSTIRNKENKCMFLSRRTRSKFKSIA